MDATPARRPLALSIGLLLFGAGLAVASASLLSAAASRAPSPEGRRDDGAPARLSGTGLYAAGSLEIAEGNLAYAPQYPLWSDGAAKRRWIRLPEGAAIDASDPDRWEFPVGTRLWKEFAFGRPVETRYLERLADGTWRFATYVWTEDGKDAVLAPAEGVPAAHEIRPGLRHDVPSRDACLACHGNAGTPVLGFTALQLSSDRDPLAPHAEPVPPGGADLASLAAAGRLAGLSASALARPPRIAAGTPTARAALGYLQANCGACHTREGPVAALGLDLAVHGPEAASGAPTTAIAVPSRFRFADDARPLRIAPGDAARSVLWRRMAARSPLSRMPPLGTHEPDAEALSLIERWIREDASSPGIAANRPHDPTKE